MIPKIIFYILRIFGYRRFAPNWHCDHCYKMDHNNRYYIWTLFDVNHFLCEECDKLLGEYVNKFFSHYPDINKKIKENIKEYKEYSIG
jgi:hypothetical protein